MATLADVQGWAQAATSDGRIQAALIGISYFESTWNPGAVGDKGCSIGLMQMNTCGGLGDGYSVAFLSDPVSNFRLAASYIASKLNAGLSLYDALQPWTTRGLAWGYIQQLLGGTASGPAPATGAVAAAPTSPLLWIIAGAFVLVVLS